MYSGYLSGYKQGCKDTVEIVKEQLDKLKKELAEILEREGKE